MDPNSVIIYGAYGYTGKLIAKRAIELGLIPILSGRNKEALEKMAGSMNLEYEVCSLEQTEKLEALLDRANVVIHCAGPFVHTSKDMVNACIKTKTHYLDITGEFTVFESCANKDSNAKEGGVMLMPGVGFDVVPSDCLALHLKNRLPEANDLQLAFTSTQFGVSRGTAKSVVEGMGYGGYVRRNHKLQQVPAGYKTQKINFGAIEATTVSIPWGDISTAYRSTGIPNIEVFMGMPSKTIAQLKRSNYFGWLLRARFFKKFLKGQIDKKPPGPSSESRSSSKTFLWGKVTDANGQSKESLLETPEGYTITAQTAPEIAKRVLEGNFKTGFQTPASIYGADFILQFDGCSRKDL